MNSRSLRARFTVLAGVAAGVLFLSGCSGGSTASQAAPPPARPAAAETPAASGQPAPPVTPAAAAPQTTLVPPMVQEHETGVEVTLAEARRTSGDSVTLKWRYRNTTSQPVKLSKGGTSWSDAYRLTSGTFLVDPVNKKKYLVITDDQGYPLASKHGDWQGVTLEPGQTLSAWAKLPAPPADVEKVTVTIAGVPPYEDVPVAR